MTPTPPHLPADFAPTATTKDGVTGVLRATDSATREYANLAYQKGWLDGHKRAAESMREAMKPQQMPL